MRYSLLILALCLGCSHSSKPSWAPTPQKSTFAEDLDLQIRSQQTHQDTLDRIHAQGVLERQQMTLEHNQRMRRINRR